jgi:C_GCAxxG_C_C family probable redox protein
MWEAYDMKDENLLWAGIPFMGGISGQNLATCGAVSGMALSLGLRHRCSLGQENKENAKTARTLIRNQSGQIAREFIDKFGHVTCQELLGIDFSKPRAYQEFRGAGIAENKCYQYVYFLIEKMYEFEDKA